MKKSLLALCILFLFATELLAGTHPFTVTCPRDGQQMMFDHQVGFGKDSVCWYSHTVFDSEAGSLVKHEAHIACPN
jgi:hypothetical protein